MEKLFEVNEDGEFVHKNLVNMTLAQILGKSSQHRKASPFLIDNIETPQHLFCLLPPNVKAISALAKLIERDYSDRFCVIKASGSDGIRKESQLLKLINKAKADGKINNIGFSYHGSPHEFQTLLDDFPWDMVLVQYNYLDVNAQAGFRGIQYAYENDIAVFVMEPLKGGLLAGELPPEVSALFDEVDSSKSSVDWALSWVFNQNEITCVLSGMGSLDQMKENMAIAERVEIGSLSDDELDVLDKAQGIFNSMMKINCTGCGYCLPCPKGVNIPDCFNVYNEKYLFNKKAFGVLPHAMVNYYMVVGGITNKQASAGLCNHCGRCKRLCPQSLDIPNELDRVKSEFELLGFNYQIKFVKNVAMPSINKISKVFDFFKHF